MLSPALAYRIELPLSFRKDVIVDILHSWDNFSSLRGESSSSTVEFQLERPMILITFLCMTRSLLTFCLVRKIFSGRQGQLEGVETSRDL